jgi:hypothetical protein
MKKLVFVSLAVISFHVATYAQELYQTQGMTLIGASYGIAPGKNGSTQVVGLDYSKFLRKNWMLNVSGLYEFGAIQTTKANNYLLKSGIDYSMFQIGNVVFFNTGLSVLGGAELLKSSVNSDKKNSFVGGVSGNVNVRIFLFGGFVLQLQAEQNYLPGSMLGKWYPSYFAGIKYCIF